MAFHNRAIVGFSQEHGSKPKTLSREFYGNLLILYSKCIDHRETLNYYIVQSFMCILNEFTEVDILCFSCMKLNKILFHFHKKKCHNPVLLL